ncbi:MAG: mandelate racemase/muconate lactonizing enzyme family protein [Candidatus Methylomirabilales bacterium]
MKITNVRSVLVRIPLQRPVRIATREVRGREFVLTFVQTEDGTQGVGYTYAGTVGGTMVRTAVDDVLRPLLLGADAGLIERHWATMFQDGLLVGRRGALLRAISAVDIALWDLAGKRAGIPLSRLLGGYQAEVPAYASGGYYLEGKGPDGLAREMERYLRAGFTSVKIKVGGASIEEDVARVKAARDAIGPSVRLALDANNAYRSVSEAVRAAEAFQPYDIWWFEEPLAPDNIPGQAEVAEAVGMPVATGEIHQTRWDFRDLIMGQAAQILQPDAGVLGGISEWMKVAHTAASFDIPVAPHWHADLHVHLVGAVSNALTVEYFFLEEDIYNFERILRERLVPSKGSIRIPDRPGLGLVLDQAAIERFTIR